MTGYLVIEPCAGETYRHDGKYAVYRYDTYPEGSVLAGQERRSFVDSFPSVAEARVAYPKADVSEGSGYRPLVIPRDPPPWFDETAAGETWDDPDGYDRNGAWDGFQVTSDAEGGL